MMADTTPDRRWWAAALVLFAIIVFGTEFVQVHGFWGSYVIDIFGPAMVYIYIRGLSAKRESAKWRGLFSPELAVFTVALVCFLVEFAQYISPRLSWPWNTLYKKHYDPYDFLAYVSLLVPCYSIDRWLLNRRSAREAEAHE